MTSLHEKIVGRTILEETLARRVKLRTFLEATKLSREDWWKIYLGRRRVTKAESKRIGRYFGVNDNLFFKLSTIAIENEPIKKIKKLERKQIKVEE